MDHHSALSPETQMLGEMSLQILVLLTKQVIHAGSKEDATRILKIERNFLGSESLL